MSEKGKAFENKIAGWLKKEDYYYERFFDSRSAGFITSARPADYFVYHNKQLYYIELKERQSNKIQYSALTQLKGLNDKYRYGIFSFFIIGFNAGKDVVAISSKQLYCHIMFTSIKKHITMEETLKIGIKIDGHSDLKKILPL